MVSDKDRRAKADAKKRAENKFKFTSWADNSWKGTNALEALKLRLSKPRVKVEE